MTTRRRGLMAGAAAGVLGTLLGRATVAAGPGTRPALFIATHGADDPNRATFPFLLARGVVRAGQPVEILLIGDGTTLIGPGVMDTVVAAGPPPLRDIYADLTAVTLRICMGCARARGITDADVASLNAAWIAGTQLDDLIAGAGRVASF